MFTPLMTSRSNAEFTGLILAGGQGRRMQGQDKGLLEFDGQRLIDHAIATLQSVTPNLLISVNRNLETYLQLGFPVITDTMNDYPGPLAGILAAIETGNHPLLIMPCDAPAAPAELFQRLAAALTAPAVAVVAHDGTRLQPAFLALAPSTHESLHSFLQRGERKLTDWVNSLDPVVVDCSDHPEWFRNVNTPAELEALDPSETSCAE